MAGALNWAITIQEGDTLPTAWLWLYFNPVPMASQTGGDGHPARGGFMPPVSLPRRMWAGSRAECLKPVYVGDQVARRSRILDVQLKQGGTGDLVFVTVQHEISVGEALKVREQQDIVYREPSSAGASKPAAQQSAVQAQFGKTITPDPVLLFRYAALTFNGHRIHYDREYATQQEGYPALVVQGPLTATLLLDLLREQLPQETIRNFHFRGLQPLFDNAPFQVCGHRENDKVLLWAENSEGAMTMKMDVTLQSAAD
jgi:3-methylfumaryl-CoA hydratase